MPDRIELADIISFRLRVPDGVLERLVEELKPELSLELVRQGVDVLLSQVGASCFLLFRPVEGGLVLREVVISQDVHGLFFQQVLGVLMVEHGGDLEARLEWNVPRQEERTHVSIERGVTSYPGLSAAVQALRSSLQAAPDPGGAAATAGEAVEELSPEDKELERLLERARASWEEYLRLKSRG